MLGNIYKNPELASESDGFWTFDGKGLPHEHWCVIKIKGDMVLLAPLFFEYADNLSNDIMDSGVFQVVGKDDAISLILGRCITRPRNMLNTKRIALLTPQMAKKACQKLCWMMDGK